MSFDGAFFLNTYKPLVASEHGRRASRDRNLAPFVDGSIRREPDLEHAFPPITCTCRKDKFAPRLRVGDTVAYLTAKKRYLRGGQRERRLTAVLLVIDRCESHAAAAGWYRERCLALPNNCMVPENPPKPLEESHMLFKGDRDIPPERLLRIWDRNYVRKTSEFGAVAICRPLFISLAWDAPVVADQHLLAAFGKIPGTQNPGTVPAGEFHELMRLLAVVLQPCAQ